MLTVCCLWRPAPANATACTAGCVQFVDNSTGSSTSPNITIAGVVAGHALHVWFCLNGPTAVNSVTTNGQGNLVKEVRDKREKC